MLIDSTFSETLRANRSWIKPSLRGSYSKSLTRFSGLDDDNNTISNSILYETTFPLKEIHTLLSNSIQSEPFVQLIQEFIQIAQVIHIFFILSPLFIF